DRLRGPIVVLTGPSRRQQPVERDYDYSIDSFDSLERLRALIPDDEARRIEWIRCLVAEGMFEMFDPTIDFIDDPYMASFEAAVRHCFGTQAEAILYGEPPQAEVSELVEQT